LTQCIITLIEQSIQRDYHLPSLYILYQYHLNESRRQIILGTLSIVKYPVRRVSPILLLLLTRLCPPYILLKGLVYAIYYTLSIPCLKRKEREGREDQSMLYQCLYQYLYQCFIIVISLIVFYIPCTAVSYLVIVFSCLLKGNYYVILF